MSVKRIEKEGDEGKVQQASTAVNEHHACAFPTRSFQPSRPMTMQICASVPSHLVMRPLILVATAQTPDERGVTRNAVSFAIPVFPLHRLTPCDTQLDEYCSVCLVVVKHGSFDHSSVDLSLERGLGASTTLLVSWICQVFANVSEPTFLHKKCS